MKATNVVMAVVMVITLQITALQAQPSDALSSLLHAKVLEETDAITEMYLLYDNVPNTASGNWNQTETPQVSARNSVQIQQQFTESVAELAETVAQTEMSAQPLSLDEQIHRAVEQEESALFQSYLNDRYMENLTNCTCYYEKKMQANPKNRCSNISSEEKKESL